MQPINLLPPYIYDKSKKRTVGLAWGLGALALIALFGIWWSGINATLGKAKEERDIAVQHKSAYDGYTSQINDVKSKIAETQKKHDFIVQARTWNDAWPGVYEMMRDVTSDQILLKSLALDPATRQRLDFSGFSGTEMNIVRWWMLLRNNADKFDAVVFSLPVEGYAGGAVAGAPGMMGGFRPGGAGGFGAASPASMNMQMQARGGMNRMAGGPGAGSGGSMGGRGGISGAPMASGFGGRPMGMSGFGPTAGRGGAGGDVGPAEIEGRPGIDFTAYAMLKTPLAGGMQEPVWGAPVGPAVGGMPGGAFPGMMGMGRGGVSGMPQSMGASMGAMGGSAGGMGRK